jgi:hypothetical protein
VDLAGDGTKLDDVCPGDLTCRLPSLLDEIGIG